jgi:hypothetical protein
MALALGTGPYMIDPDRFITEGACLAIHEFVSNDRVAAVIALASGIKSKLPFSGNPPCGAAFGIGVP